MTKIQEEGKAGYKAQNPNATVLVVDEHDTIALLKEWLSEENCKVCGTADSKEALRLFYDEKPSLVIIELYSSTFDTYKVIELVRCLSSATHIIALSGLNKEQPIIRAFHTGADLCLIKPLHKPVFLAQVCAVLRRAIRPGELPTCYSDDFVTLNFLTHKVGVKGTLTHLGPTEFRLLAYLIRNRERVVGHEEILNAVWSDEDGSLESLRWYISSLRKKIEENRNEPKIIVNVKGVGYRYALPSETNLNGTKSIQTIL